MIETLDIFGKTGMSRKSKIKTNLDSTRSTLFGKFYEGIIANWLEKNHGYIHLQGKPCVYWDNTNLAKNSSDQFIKSLNNVLKIKKKNNVRANLDGIFEKNNKLYLWEAKNWPQWNGGKQIKEQVYDLLSNSPWLLAKEAKHNGEVKKIHGVLFSWWQRFEGEKKFQKDLSRQIRLPFKIFFTSEIIDDCRNKKYKWYRELVGEQENNILGFFEELYGKK